MTASLPLHRPDIDGLRAIAILGALLFHAFPAWLPGGFAGVDVFFVISGYVVSLNLLARREHGWPALGRFYGRRIRRLFPALIVFLLSCAAVGWWLLPVPPLQLLGKHMLSSAAYVQNLVLWRESGYFDVNGHEKWLLHLWSLGVEEQFYLLLPLLLLPRALQGRRQTVLLMLAGFVSLGICLWTSVYAPSTGFFGPLSRFWEFLLGVGIAQWQLRTRSVSTADAPSGSINPSSPKNWRQAMHTPSADRWANACAASALMALLLAFATLPIASGAWQFPGPLALWPVLASACLLLTAPAWVNQSLLAHPAMVYIGLISYPLYLWHWPILAYLNTLDPQHTLVWPRALGVVLALGLAAATLHGVERPARRLAGARFPWGWLIAMAAVGGLGAWLWLSPTPGLRASHIPSIARDMRWDDATLYRDTTCLSHQGVNPWPRHDFFCRGDPDRAQWVLLGDSHGNAVAAGLMQAQPDRWLNLGGGGCMPFDGVDSGSTNLGLQCPADLPSAFLAHILAAPNITGVLIQLRGPLYTSGVGVGPAEAGIHRWLRPAGVSPLLAPNEANDARQLALFRDGVARTLAQLAPHKRLVWLLNTPELGANVPTCLQPLPGTGWLGPEPVCNLPRSAHEARSASYHQIVRDEVAHWNATRPEGAPLVQVLDPADALCTPKSCPLVMHDQPLYRDGDHLSIQGSRQLTDWLLPQLGTP